MTHLPYRLPSLSHSSRDRSTKQGLSLRIGLIFLLASSASLAPAWAQSAVPDEGASPPRPRLTVAEPSFLTGEVARDSVVEHTFVLRNEGDAPLEIRNLVATGNVELMTRPTGIAPGGTAELKVRIPLLPDAAGALLKQIEIQSNDPDKPSFGLEVRILSIEIVKPTPAKARWISVQYEKEGTISPQLKSVDGQPFRILRISTPPPGVEVAYRAEPTSDATGATPPTVPSAGASSPAQAASSAQWRVDLTLKQNAPVGAIVGRLLVEIDHPKQKTVPIPLSGFMRPVIAVTPYELKLGELALTTEKTAEFLVRNFATEPIQVTKVEHNLPGFGEATIVAVEAGRRYSVRVAMDPTKVPKGPVKGSLRIQTDSPKVPVYTVPVEGIIK